MKKHHDTTSEADNIGSEKVSTSMLVSPTVPWYEQLPEDEKPRTEKEATPDEVTPFHSRAVKLLRDDCQAYDHWQKATKKGTDYEWTKKVLESGTLSDKIAAYTLLIQESPTHSLSYVDNLLRMVRAKGSKESVMAVESLKELFLSSLLVPDRKLKWLKQRPLNELSEMMSGNKRAQDKVLLLWYLEDQIKLRYAGFITSLNELSRNNVDHAKEKVITVMQTLLGSHPELEQALLSHLVNKIGDPSRKIASRTSYRLCLLLDQHPNMKTVVVKEVEKLLFRSNITTRAQYYGICFLTQTIFDEDDTALAVRMINIYLGFFKAAVKKGEVDSRLMSGLLTGVNRAFPFAATAVDQVLEHINTLYKLLHLVSFSMSVQTLMLLQRVSFMTPQLTDRYYCCLYRKLMDPHLLTGSTRHLPNFLNLIFRSLKSDSSQSRVHAFLKRLLQGCKYMPAQLICGILILTSEVLKRISFLRRSFLKSEIIDKYQSDDDDEHYEDVDERENSSEETVHQQSSWMHKTNLNRKNYKNIQGYNPCARNPQFAGAECVPTWELQYLAQHYHPTVRLFSQTILNGDPIDYTGDPLHDFSTIRFLDRFVFRNPKKNTSIGQTESRHILGRRDLYEPVGARGMPLQSKQYLQFDENQIPPEELFLYQYMKNQEEKKAMKNDDDTESVASDEFVELIEKSGPRDVLPDIDDDDEDFDFAQEFHKYSEKGKKSNKKQETEDDAEEAIDFDDGDKDGMSSDDDDDLDMSDNDIFQELSSEDENELEANFPGLHEALDKDLVEEEIPTSKKRKRESFDKSRKKKKNVEEVFAPAEEFSEMLEDNIGIDMSGSNAVRGADKIATKQLKWEEKRTNQDWRRKKRDKFFKKKRSHTQQLSKNKKLQHVNTNKRQQTQHFSKNKGQQTQHFSKNKKLQTQHFSKNKKLSKHQGKKNKRKR